MNIFELQKKIEKEEQDKKICENYAKALNNAPKDFKKVVEDWVAGKEENYVLGEISLDMIREKENCSYFKALVRMLILIEEPVLAGAYKNWKPVNKDWSR